MLTQTLEFIYKLVKGVYNMTMKLGDKVFKYDPKTKEITEGELVGLNISEESGYVLCSIQDETGNISRIEEAHVYLDQVFAASCSAEKEPTIQEANDTIKQATDKVNELRVKVIGNPPFAHVVEKYKNRAQL
jgi:hypothetical protein